MTVHFFIFLSLFLFLLLFLNLLLRTRTFSTFHAFIFLSLYLLITLSSTPNRLRIHFIAPGIGIGGPSINQQFPSLVANPDRVFLRELTYRLGSEKYLTTLLRQIQEMRKKWNQRLALKKQAESIVEQDRLIVSTQRDIPRLQNILIRPTLGTCVCVCEI